MRQVDVMESDEDGSDRLGQPATVESATPARPPLDWGDEEPDTVWQALYDKGLVDPPYRSGKDFVEFMRVFLKDRKPVGKPMSDDELMCALGRCHCGCCE
jgi:hypothetical protein